MGNGIITQQGVSELETLPLCIKLPNKINNKPVVVTNASCTDVWHHHDTSNGAETFRKHALWNRPNSNPDCEISNTFSHSSNIAEFIFYKCSDC